MSGASERRIRNNRIRRRREMRHNIMMCILTVALVISFSMIFFSIGSKAQSSDEEISYKYYKSITVEDGDTLWDYAKQYGDSEYYNNSQAYIEEVIKINALTDSGITSGQHIVLPYYSTQFVG